MYKLRPGLAIKTFLVSAILLQAALNANSAAVTKTSPADCSGDYASDEEPCSSEETDVPLFGTPSCLTLLQAGASCTPTTPTSTSACARGLVCNARLTCSKATKGNLCTDDTSVCAAGLVCERISSRRRDNSSPGPVRSSLYDGVEPSVCRRVNAPIGAYCSLGEIETKNIAPEGTWRRGRRQVSTIAYDTISLDYCADGLWCVKNRCVAPGDGFRPGNTFQDATNLVPVGAACDDTGKKCPDVNFSWMSALKRPREVRTSCVGGVCVSTEDDYPVGRACAEGCGDSLQCGEDGRCVDAQLWIYSSLGDQPDYRYNGSPMVGEACPFGWCNGDALCKEGVCTSFSGTAGLSRGDICVKGGQACGEDLVCEEVVGDNISGAGLRCTLKTIVDGGFCEAFDNFRGPVDTYARYLSRTCRSGSAACKYLGDDRRCIGARSKGERCSVYETSYCVDGTTCVYGTCVE